MCNDTSTNINDEKTSKRTWKQFLKDPHRVTKKLFTESKNGISSCTKVLNVHIKETYSNPHFNQQLSLLIGLKRLLKSDIEFQTGKNDFMIKSRAKSAQGSDNILYKVYKY